MSDIVGRLRSDRGAGSAHWADCEEAAAEIERLRAENAALREALDGVMIGGNHVALLIGADHPPHTASHDDALTHYGAGRQYEAWCCWRSIMHARAALEDK